MSRVVLLNGVSSVGKGSLAKALQRVTAQPMLHVQMDAFLEMMPPGSATPRAMCSKPVMRTASR